MCDNNSITLSCPRKYDGIKGALQSGSLCDDVLQIRNPAAQTAQDPLAPSTLAVSRLEKTEAGAN